jgi:hypothetical protein
MIDALAFEVQFLHHLAPVWRALPSRGRFLVDPTLVPAAEALGIEAVPTPRPPHTVAYPPPRFDGPPALVASYGDVKEGRRLGYGPFAFLEHGIGQSYGHSRRPNGSYSGGSDRDDNTLFLVPGPDPARRWREAYPGARVEEVGSPRLDFLPARLPGPGPVIATSFHWPAPLSISGYAGTAVGDYIGVLPELAKRYTVIGHCHPKGDWPERMRRQYQRLGIPFVADFHDVCRQADVYVCDNSSTLYEFAATGRPVVVLNARHWQRGPELGLRFWAAAHVGINVDRPADLMAAVERTLEHRPEDIAAREDALEEVYTYRHGAAERAAAAIVDWLDGREAAAA